jgi:hypothetical protein
MCDYGQGNGDFSDEESLLKRQQDALDEIAQLRQDVDNRFTFEAPDIAKRYVEGRLEICLNLRSRRCGQEFKGFVRCALPQIFERNAALGGWPDRQTGLKVHPIETIGAPNLPLNCQSHVINVCESPLVFQMLATTRPDDERHSVPNGKIANLAAGAEVYWHKSKPMFVLSVDHMQQAQKRVTVPSEIRFAIADKFGCPDGELFLFQKLGFEFIEVAPEGKLDLAVGLFADADNNFRQHVVECGPEIVQNFAGQDRKFMRWLLAQFETPNFLIGFRIDLGDNFVTGRFEEGSEGDIELLDLGFGPLGLEKRPQERRFRVHDIESVMAKTDPTKNQEFKRVLGNLLNAPPKLHADMKLGKRSAKKAKSPEQRGGRARPKSA